MHCSSETSERSRTVIIDSDAGFPEPSDPQRHHQGYDPSAGVAEPLCALALSLSLSLSHTHTHTHMQTCKHKHNTCPLRCVCIFYNFLRNKNWHLLLFEGNWP